MTSRRIPLLLPLSALVLLAGCAGAAQPALEVGATSYSRAELLDAVADELGSEQELPDALDRAAFISAANNLVIDGIGTEIAADVERRGIEANDEDLLAIASQLQLPDGFDPGSLEPQQRQQYDLQLNVTSLGRVIEAEGGSMDEYLADLFASVRLDPRYGSFAADTGVVAPVLSGADIAPAVLPLAQDDGS